MDNTPYAPPQAPVADITPGPLMTRPWQVRVAVWLCSLGLLMTLPEAIRDFLFAHSGVNQMDYKGAMLFVYVPLCGLFGLLFVLLAHGIRWARIGYSVLTLLGLFGMMQSVPLSFERAWYFGVLNLLTGLMSAVTLWLLFTGPANAWFRTRGGRIEAT
jgi:hypothetical protein